jgi:hypothetical protein
VKHILTFFRHYLIARQLNDDAHDWEADLKLGQVNAVGCLVLKKARVRRALSLTQIAPQLQPVFWNTVIVEVCHLIFHHLGQAKQALHASKLITQPAILENLLTKYEVAAHEALREREKTLEFLAAY